MVSNQGGNFTSLILATYGRCDDVGRLVASLITQTDRCFELIIVDQNLDERLAIHIESAIVAGISVQHLRMDKPNLSAARNNGLDVARGDWVAFPDDDCWYEPDTLAQVTGAVRSDLGCLVIDWAEQTMADGNPRAESRLELHVWRSFHGGDASSITLFVRRELAQKLGGFDARLGVGQWFGAGEETDFVLRALALGARIERLASAHVHHAYGLVSNLPINLLWQSTVARERGTGALYAKHRLSLFVMLRGFLSPVPSALFLHWRGWLGLVKASAMTVGRVQGWLGWKNIK